MVFKCNLYVYSNCNFPGSSHKVPQNSKPSSLRSTHKNARARKLEHMGARVFSRLTTKQAIAIVLNFFSFARFDAH